MALTSSPHRVGAGPSWDRMIAAVEDEGRKAAAILRAGHFENQRRYRHNLAHQALRNGMSPRRFVDGLAFPTAQDERNAAVVERWLRVRANILNRRKAA